MVVAVAAGGDHALALEDHWIRWVDAAAFLFAGAAGARSRALPRAVRALLFAAGALLAADELAMLHESRPGPLAALHSARLRDVPVLVYGIAGLGVVGSLALAPRAAPGVGPHLIASACGIAAVIASDALRAVPRSVEHVVEEGGELLGAVALGVALSSRATPPARLLTAWLAGVAVAGALAVGILAAQPTLCPGLAKARRLAGAQRPGSPTIATHALAPSTASSEARDRRRPGQRARVGRGRGPVVRRRVLRAEATARRPRDPRRRCGSARDRRGPS